MPLAQLLRERHPTVLLLSERRLRKLLAQLIDRGARLPCNADLPLALEAHQRNSLKLFDDRVLPHRVVLLTPPDDRSLHGADECTIAALYSRLLFFAYLQESLKPRECLSVWATLTLAQQREVRFVLDSEHRLPDAATDEEVAAAFVPHLMTLLDYQPEAAHSYYPLLAMTEALQAALPSVESRQALLRECELRETRPSGSVSSTSAPSRSRLSDPALLDAWIAKGNFVRVIITAPQTPSGNRALREHLLGGLAGILDWNAAIVEAWHAALQPVIAAAGRSAWPHEKRALYDLQRLVADHSGLLDAVAPVEWLASFGRQPLRRSLEPVRDVILARRLRAVARHLQRSTLTLAERQPIEALLETELEHREERIRSQFAPVLQQILGEAGYEPSNLPERIGRDKTIAELLDRLSENGLLRFADVRDAIARNHLKLPDCTRHDFLHGDALLTADRKLHQALYGVYHRGEIYLRGIQRFSSLAFGTPLGRWLTLFVALPFGGAFLAVEATKHLLHAVRSLARLAVKLIEKPEFVEVQSKPHHPPAFDEATLATMATLGVLLLLVINVPRARGIALDLASLLGRLLRAAFIALPGFVLKSQFAKWLFDNRATRFLNAYLLLPGLLALALVLLLLMLDIRNDIIIAAGVTAFTASALLAVTRWGREFREDLAEAMHDMGRRVLGEFLPAFFSWILWLFRELLGLLERGLYTIDEWFRYREGQSKPSLVAKASLALLWFPFAYVLRFAFYLLLEPQVNPIKHFPVVTVSHKVMIPLIETVKDLLHVSIEMAGFIISLIPGIFGFLVWEFKENWRLYAANRPANLPVASLGHHGESIRGLLRPGFHSGTIPKLFRRLRRWFADERRSSSRRDKLDGEHHHLHVALERLVERDLFAYWRAMPGLGVPCSLAEIRIGVQRIEIAIGPATPLRLSFENVHGTIVGTVDEAGWLIDLEEPEVVQHTLAGFFATAAAGEMAWAEWQDLGTDSGSRRL